MVISSVGHKWFFGWRAITYSPHLLRCGHSCLQDISISLFDDINNLLGSLSFVPKVPNSPIKVFSLYAWYAKLGHEFSKGIHRHLCIRATVCIEFSGNLWQLYTHRGEIKHYATADLCRVNLKVTTCMVSGSSFRCGCILSGTKDNVVQDSQ